MNCKLLGITAHKPRAIVDNIEFSCPAASAQHCMEYETECTATSDL